MYRGLGVQGFQFRGAMWREKISIQWGDFLVGGAGADPETKSILDNFKF